MGISQRAREIDQKRSRSKTPEQDYKDSCRDCEGTTRYLAALFTHTSSPPRS